MVTMLFEMTVLARCCSTTLGDSKGRTLSFVRRRLPWSNALFHGVGFVYCAFHLVSSDGGGVGGDGGALHVGAATFALQLLLVWHLASPLAHCVRNGWALAWGEGGRVGRRRNRARTRTHSSSSGGSGGGSGTSTTAKFGGGGGGLKDNAQKSRRRTASTSTDVTIGSTGSDDISVGGEGPASVVSPGLSKMQRRRSWTLWLARLVGVDDREKRYADSNVLSFAQ
jgi:hypothetical protein